MSSRVDYAINARRRVIARFARARPKLVMDVDDELIDRDEAKPETLKFRSRSSAYVYLPVDFPRVSLLARSSFDPTGRLENPSMT